MRFTFGLISLLFVSCLHAEVPKPVGEVQKLASGFKYTEGPAWDGIKSLYFSDIPNFKMHQWTQESGVRDIRTGEHASNGIVIDRQGQVIFCEVTGRRIVRRSADGSETTLADTCDGKPFAMPNDLWLAPNGSIYFTVPKPNAERAKLAPEGALSGILCLISADGKSVRSVGQGIVSPNGVVGTADGKRLIVADPGASKCWSYPIQPDGNLGEQTLVADQGSDGLALDEFGQVYTTAKGGIVVYADAKQIAMIPIPEGPSNMKFGGTDGRTLFITAKTGLYSVNLNVRGDGFAKK